MQQIEYALRSAQIQRTTTTRGTNSTYTHSSLLPLDVNTSPYEKRRGRDRVVEHSHHEYWFAFLHPVIVLTLPDRIARYVCTNNRAPNGNKSRSRRWKRERGGEKRGRRRVVARGKPSHPFEIDCRAKAIENITNRSLRGEGNRVEEPASAATPFAAPIYHFENIRSKGDGFAEKAARKNATWIHTCLW